MPDIFNTYTSINLEVICGESLSQLFEFDDDVEEAIFQSPDLYINLTKKEDSKWELNIPSDKTFNIKEGKYWYTIQTTNTLGVKETVIEDIITFIPYSLSSENYEVVIKEQTPTDIDNIYPVPTIWYSTDERELYLLSEYVYDRAVWIKINNSQYIFQNNISEEFKFKGNTSIYSFVQFMDNKITFIPGEYDYNSGFTDYRIPVGEIRYAEFYLYVDKTIEDKQEIELDSRLILNKYIYSNKEFNSYNKLSSEFIDDSNSDNKFVTVEEKETWNSKQDALPEAIKGKYLHINETTGNYEWKSVNNEIYYGETTPEKNKYTTWICEDNVKEDDGEVIISYMRASSVVEPLTEQTIVVVNNNISEVVEEEEIVNTEGNNISEVVITE